MGTRLDSFTIYRQTVDTSSGVSCFIHGRAPYSGDTSLYLPGQFSQKIAPLYIFNASNISSGITLYTIAETYSGDASMNLWIGDRRTAVENSSAVPLVIPYDASTLPSGYNSSSTPLFMGGVNCYNTALFPLWIRASKDSKNASIPLFLESQPIDTTGSATLFIDSFGVIDDDINSIPLYLRVKEQVDSIKSIPLNILGTLGHSSGYKKTSLYMTSNLDPQHNLNLYSKGFEVARQTTLTSPLYSRGALSVVADSGMDMMIYNIQATESNSMSMFTFSTIPTPTTSGTTMYVDAHGTNNSVSELYVNGF